MDRTSIDTSKTSHIFNPMSYIPSEVWMRIFDRLSLESMELCCQGLNKAFNGFLLEWRVRTLCWVLAAKGVDEVVRRLKRHNPSGISADLGRLDQVRRFVERHRDAKVKSALEWMQLASQEPDAGWLCQGAKKATMEGWNVMEQVLGKPQEFGKALSTVTRPWHLFDSDQVTCVAWNHEGLLLASGISDGNVELWTPDGQEKGTLWGHTRYTPGCTCQHLDPLGASDPEPSDQSGAEIEEDEPEDDYDLEHWYEGDRGCPVKGHASDVNCVAWSRDGSLLASASSDRTVKVWDPKTMEVKGTLRGHSAEVTSVAFSPDSKYVASGSGSSWPSWDNSVRIWEVSTGEEVCCLWGHGLGNPECTCNPVTANPQCPVTGHSDRVTCVAWNHDGSLVASGSDDRTVRLWTPDGQENGTLRGHTRDDSECKCKFDWRGRVETSDPECPVRGHSGSVCSVAWNHDGSLVASGSDDKTVRLWTPDGQLKGTLRGHSRDNPECKCKFGSLGRVETAHECPVKGHSGTVLSVAWNHDGSLFSSDDYTVKLWDPTTMEEKGTLTGHSGTVLSVAWNHDGSLLASWSGDETVRLWTPDGQEKGILRWHPLEVTCVAWNLDWSLLALGSSEGTVQLWSPDGQKKGTLKGHSGTVLSVAWNHDGSLFSSDDYTVKLWDPTTMEEKGTLTGHSDRVTCVAWNHDGSLVASGSDDRTVRLWTPDGQENGTLRGHTRDDSECKCKFDWRGRVETSDPECPVKGHSSEVHSVAFSPDSKTLASASYDMTIKLWDLSGDAPVEKGTLRGHDCPVLSVAYSPDGKFVASGSGDIYLDGRTDCVKIWDVETMEEKGTLRGHSSFVCSVAFSPDSQILASASSDQTVKLWDLSGDAPVEKGTLKGHSREVRSVAFSPDSKTLASASDDMTIKLWDLSGDAPVEQGTLTGHVASWQGLDPETKELAAKVEEGGSAGSNKTGQYIVAANGDMVYVYKTDLDGEKQGEPLACFRGPVGSPLRASAAVETVSCRGTRVVVGCQDGQVSHCSLFDANAAVFVSD